MFTSLHWLCGIFLSLYFINSTCTNHVYVVYMGKNQNQDPVLTTKSHFQLLSKLFAREDEAKEAMLYSYKHSFSGFSAVLNSTQVSLLTNMKDVVSVFRSKALRLHTTRSWDFLGLTLDPKKVTPMQLAYGDNVVIGIFDTGIWPESASFQETSDMRPIPSSWKGKCVKGENFAPKTACNRKLVGARYYIRGIEQTFGPIDTSNGTNEYRSSRDFLGHGTHTASTAAGSVVSNATFSGFAKGVARGGSPRSRLAMYKVCWSIQLNGICTDADILAAFDDALYDGVHVISASFGDATPLSPFFASSSDIGSFHAMQLGISVVFSGGNDGFEPGLVQNVAPWGLCVAASSMDRSFSTQMIIDNNITITGEGFNKNNVKAKLVNARRYFSGSVCNFDNWNGKRASGNIILCFSTSRSIADGDAVAAALAANASGLIIAEPMTKQIADNDLLPTVHIDINQGTRIMHYISQSPQNPTIVVQPSKTTFGRLPAPVVAYFSSRGPSSLAPEILKPDISAPGINILAAWPPNVSPTFLPTDLRSTNWNFQSGTSMSCPHVSGVVALLKSAHPDWSSAAIKSALMTTANMKDTTQDAILAGGSMKVSDPFDIGSGHIDPLKAMDPGLIYDMNIRDYIIFLCNLGYTEDQITRTVGQSPDVDTRCPCTMSSNAELNYPSITIPNLVNTMTVKRTVRNVGSGFMVYYVRVVKPRGVQVEVSPRMLMFSCYGKEMSYYVTVTSEKCSQGRYDFGEIVWSDGHHYVRIPLVVRVNTNEKVNNFTTHVSI